MLQISAFHILRSHSRGLARVLAKPRRGFSILTGESQPGNSHRSQVVSTDGRVFTFATLVFSPPDKSTSALSAWSQACSLVGTDTPTLAIAFVSKHNPSSAAALEEISKLIQPNLILDPKLNPPFIGCVADFWSAGAPASSSPGGTEKKSGTARSDGFKKISTGGEEVKAITVKNLTSSEFLDDDNDEEDFKALVGECARWTRDHPGAISDEESLISLDKELKSANKQEKEVKLAVDKEKELKAAEDKVEELALQKEECEQSSKQVTEKEKQISSAKMESVSKAEKSLENIAALEATADGGNAGPTPTTEKSEGQSGEGQGQPSDESTVVEDDGYSMILCVADMPGTKAYSFYTSTTGLPNLPDMEAAVIRNNPHMVLLGAAGYPYPEFVQRLSTIFPESCRAGAFLAPLYTSPKMRSKCTEYYKQIFLGTKHHSSGVVGLALASDGEDCKVPMDAFTEFLRMSLGMARIPGHTFFDNASSNSLFLPKNVVKDRQASCRSSPLDPNTLLKRLNTYLIKHSKVQTQTNLGNASSSQQQNSVDATKDVVTCMTSVEVKSSDVHSQQGEPQASDNSESIPLALFDTVLFPGWSMPLHMHEPRYRHLVRHCVEEGKPFGLTSYWHWQNPEELVGTMANLKVYLFEKDCRSYVVAHGVQRFRLTFDRMWVKPGSFGLNMGQVELFDDNEWEQNEELCELAKQVVDRCRRLMPEAESAPGLVGSITDPTRASFAVGQLLPVPVRVKRRWLGMADTKVRLLEQMTFLDS